MTTNLSEPARTPRNSEDCGQKPLLNIKGDETEKKTAGGHCTRERGTAGHALHGGRSNVPNSKGGRVHGFCLGLPPQQHKRGERAGVIF